MDSLDQGQQCYQLTIKGTSPSLRTHSAILD